MTAPAAGGRRPDHRPPDHGRTDHRRTENRGPDPRIRSSEQKKRPAPATGRATGAGGRVVGTIPESLPGPVSAATLAAGSRTVLDQGAILARIKSLPPAPIVLTRVLSIMDDATAGVRELVSAIELDPGVTATVLKTCNSPVYGGTRQLASLDEAAHRVGMRTIIQIVMMREAQSILEGEQSGYGFAAGDLWKHSMTVALAARLLAQRVGFANVSGLFTGGLLHDMGKLVLDVHLKTSYQEVRDRVDDGSTFQEAEREVFGVEHAEIGARIAEHWAFPPSLVEMIRWHHQPDGSSDHLDACCLVHLADALAHWLGVGLGRPGLAVRFESSSVRRFGLGPEDLDRILIELVEKTQQTEQSLAA